MLGDSLILLSLAALATAKQVSGIFTAIDNVYKEGPNKGATYNRYKVSIPWEIYPSEVDHGDTFQLTLECVYKASTSFELVDGPTVLAKCDSTSSATYAANKVYTCTATDAINTKKGCSGDVSMVISLNTGFSDDSSTLNCAKAYATPGTNTLTFSDGSNKITSPIYLQDGVQYSDNPNQIQYGKFSSDGTSHNYLLAGNCPKGYTTGTLGIQTDVDKFDCNTLKARITNQLNEFYYPESASLFPPFVISCSDKKVTVTYKNIPAGERPFINIDDDQSADQKRKYTYTNTYQCVGSNKMTDNDITKNCNHQKVPPPDSNGQGSSLYDASSLPASLPAGASSSAVVSSSASSPASSPVGASSSAEVSSGHITTTTLTGSVSVPTTTTITPTNSDGTTTVEIIVPPNSVIRPPTTLTGTIRTTITECPICTCYRSVVTTTGVNGTPSSETVGIIVTTNSVGSVYTSISRQHTATVTGVITAYVTTCVATLPGGVVATSTASVVVATNSHGSIFTRSEIIGYASNIPGQISSYITTYVSSIGNSVVTTSHEVIVATISVGSTYITSMPNGGPVEPTLGVAVPGNQGQPQPPSGPDVATTGEGGKPPSSPGVQDTTTLTGAPSVETESQTIAGFDSTGAPSSIPFANAANTIKTQSVFALVLLSMFVNFF